MIIPYIFFFFILVAITLWLFGFLAKYPDVMIYWQGNAATISTTDLVAYLLLSFFIFYTLLQLLRHVVKMSYYIRHFREKKRHKNAQASLMKGLIALIDGNWKIAEQHLTNDVKYSNIPVLNYLGAARVAQEQKEYDQRDMYFKHAHERAKRVKASTAITIAQADMQLHAKQLEQARAGLITLLEDNPKHNYAKQLLIKVYYRQEDWKSLNKLLQSIQQQNILTEEQLVTYESAALKGIFHMYANEKSLQTLQQEWQKLSSNTQKKASIVYLYSQALIMAGDSKTANTLITSTLNTSWDEQLITLYGISKHNNYVEAIKQAEAWLTEYDNNPELLLSIARLYSQHGPWKKTREYYEKSLNLAPNLKAYLEFAEHLQENNEQENAEKCYQQGLKYCIYKKGQALKLNEQ
jgi:HemY protein